LATDAAWDDDPGMKKFVAFLDRYLPGENKLNSNIAYAYMPAQTMAHILQQCGDDLTRANVMRQAENLRDLELDLLLPGIKVNTSPTDHYPIQQTRMHKFDGVRRQGFGPILELD
jgi:branched-chain amino acid transport system substrate-binding protein